MLLRQRGDRDLQFGDRLAATRIVAGAPYCSCRLSRQLSVVAAAVLQVACRRYRCAGGFRCIRRATISTGSEHRRHRCTPRRERPTQHHSPTDTVPYASVIILSHNLRPTTACAAERGRTQRPQRLHENAESSTSTSCALCVLCLCLSAQICLFPLAGTQCWVEDIAEPVADQADGEDGEHQRDAGKDADPPRRIEVVRAPY